MDSHVRTLIDAWHWSYVDVEAAFSGLGEEVLHTRPNERCLSIAEMVAHTVNSEASIILRYLLGIPKERWGEHFMLKDPYGWPPTILESPPKPELLALQAADVKAAWLDQHERFHASMAEFELSAEHRFSDAWSGEAPDVETRLRFAAYHVAYHVGQIYAVRHFFGEDTPDN